MSRSGLDGRWLLAESLRIGSIVLVGFLLAHLLGVFIAAFGVDLLYGVQSTLVAVLRYSTLLTGLLYVLTRGVGTSPVSVAHDE
jgi:hypothetical protein